MRTNPCSSDRVAARGSRRRSCGSVWMWRRRYGPSPERRAPAWSAAPVTQDNTSASRSVSRPGAEARRLLSDNKRTAVPRRERSRPVRTSRGAAPRFAGRVGGDADEARSSRVRVGRASRRACSVSSHRSCRVYPEPRGLWWTSPQPGDADRNGSEGSDRWVGVSRTFPLGRRSGPGLARAQRRSPPARGRAQRRPRSRMVSAASIRQVAPPRVQDSRRRPSGGR